MRNSSSPQLPSSPTIGTLPPRTLLEALSGDGLYIDYGAATARLRSPFASLAAQVQQVYGAFPFDTRGPFADIHVDIVHGSGLRRFVRPQAVLRVDGQFPFEPFPRDAALPLFEWGVNWYVGLRFLHCLLLHAGAVALDDRAVLLAAPPGSGKSTLTAALMHSGFRLLSDEFGVVRPGECTVHALLKPIALKNQSIDVVRAFAPAATLGPTFPQTRKGDVAHLAPSAASVAQRALPARPALIVFPRFAAGSALACSPLSPTQAFARLAFNSFNYALLGAVAFETLGDLIERTRAYELVYSDMPHAIATIRDLLREV